ncbi:hypothetical protein EJ08DRAFT_523550 [Tothia fuscella]|uniref:Uncharacterized protein n=1 Tax=Tothia fuscella TaxID=1048955 RepID=A0A9P4TU13_9PEZI|nr:hypothetical protein EJ08DRAFT_523550 [Tothia fuscella]
MRCSTSLFALAALTVGQAAAAILSHRHFHNARNAAPIAISENLEVSKRSVLSVADTSLISTLGMAGTGVNAAANNGGAWLGSDGAFTNTFQNNATEPMILVIWTGATSWVNKFVPAITVSLAPGASQVVSFADGVSGGWAGVYKDTKMVDGQLSQTWGEFTTKGVYSTVDVSREVNMAGRGMRIETSNCVTDMSTCVFTCKGGLLSCWLDYQLENCAPGSQPGANYGLSYGMPSGGCTGFGPKLKTFFY